jgi:hypothetical protein
VIWAPGSPAAKAVGAAKAVKAVASRVIKSLGMAILWWFYRKEAAGDQNGSRRMKYFLVGRPKAVFLTDLRKDRPFHSTFRHIRC